MSWIDHKTAQESLLILGQLSAVCASLGGSQSATLNEIVQAGDFNKLLSTSVDYDSPDQNDIKYARQILGFYQKSEFLPLNNVSRTGKAAERFIEAEVRCKETNLRFHQSRHRPQDVDPDIQRVLSLAAWKINAIIGEAPDLEQLQFAFGPGANTNVKGALAMPRAKLSAQLECSADLSPTVGVFLSETPHWTALHARQESLDSWRVDVRVVPGKVIFVPKNAKTHRSIAIEPLLNAFYQKGVGSLLKAKLMRASVDLSDQTRNQRYAQEGSRTNLFATVDLSMASDCLATEVVHDLLPPAWVDLLLQLRTSVVSVPQSVEIINHFQIDPLPIRDGELKLEKFSSMGNGFTFELESLIFYGICYAVCRELQLRQKDICVYGDDLIVPTPAYGLLEKVLNWCGFEVNSDKSFSSGPFRESCGADYLLGFDIRPFYQKTLVSERTLFTMHNWFLRHGEYELAAVVDQLCAPAYKIYGPDNFGDGHLVGTFELKRNRVVRRAGWDGGYFDTYSLKSRSFAGALPGDAVLPTYSVYTRSGESSETDPNIVRGSSGYMKLSIYTLQRSIFAGKRIE